MHSPQYHLPLSLAFLGLLCWWARRLRRRPTVGELVVDAKFPPFQLVAIPARVHGVVDVGEVDKGSNALRWMLLRKNVHFFNLAEPAVSVRACVHSESTGFFNSVSVCVRACVLCAFLCAGVRNHPLHAQNRAWLTLRSG